MREGGGGGLSMIWSVKLDSSSMFQLILMLVVVWICIDSLVSNICLGGILQSMDKQPIDRMQEMKRHWSSLLQCLRNWFDKTWLAEAKVMKLHHSYQQIGTSSQQTHTSQVCMKMKSKVGQENSKMKIQLHGHISDHALYHHQQKVLLFKEVVMKEQKLKLWCLYTKQNGRGCC